MSSSLSTTFLQDTRGTESSKSAEILLFELIQTLSIRQISEYLTKNPNLPILTLKDNGQYSLLHKACFLNQFDISQILLGYVKTNNISSEEIRNWVNQKTCEGYRPIHFASFHGNIRLIKLLEEHGADLSVKTNNGSNVIHASAEGDRPISIAYFRTKGFNFREKDDSGYTPLHKAAEKGMENVVYFLTSWETLLNEKENITGNTPLHLAVISGSAKVVRRLLIKGANPKIKNLEGKTPKDIASENNCLSIQQLLEEGGGLLECLGIKTSLRSERGLTSFFTFLAINGLIIAVTILFLFPFIKDQFYISSLVLLFFISFFSFLMVSSVNPGKLKTGNNNDILNLLSNNGPHTICPDCVIVKPQRSRHCECCNSCVSTYDHHCPWINNCVGERNYHFYLAFIFSTLLLLVWIVITAMLHIAEEVFEESLWTLYFEGQTFISLKLLTCFIIFTIGGVFLFPLITLNWLHFENVLTNQTTFERFSYQSTIKKTKSSWSLFGKLGKNGNYIKMNS